MDKSATNKRFQAIVRNLHEAEPQDPILALAEHPLMIKASRYIVAGEMSQGIDDADYIEILALLRWEFDLTPDEVSTAMEICEDRVAREQA